MYANVKKAIDALKNGKMILLVDDDVRENEADLIFPAENITPEMINFMIRHGTGIVCVSLLEEHLKRLNLPLMVPPQQNDTLHGTPFAIPVDAKLGVSTGVSAQDRARTIQIMMDKKTLPDELARPGHVYPLQARNGGVLERAGHTEGSVDIVRLAGFQPAAVICEVMNPDGSMARGEFLEAFAKQHDLVMLSICELIHYRLFCENQIKERSTTQIQLSDYGSFVFNVYQENYFPYEHVSLFKPLVDTRQPLLVRIHSACASGDIFASEHCDCHAQLHYALKQIQLEGGLLIYLDQEGRGIGLLNKIKAYALQREGYDTIEANEKLSLPIDARQYYIPVQILREMKVNKVRLLTNSPQKILALTQAGVEVLHEVMPTFSNLCNQRYLQTKREKMLHTIHF